MTFKRWLPTLFAFPLGGLITMQTIGSLDGPVTGGAGGLLAGAVIGAAQWAALRPHRVPSQWIVRTAVAMGAGTAVAAVMTGAGTTTADLLATGLIAGAAVGAAQAPLLPGGVRARAVWTAVTACSWTLGWFVTSSIGVDVERGYHVFGSSGALLVTVLTGLAVRRAVRPAPSASARRPIAVQA